MKLTQSLAEKIVKKTMEVTQLNINVMNKDGIIISSSNPERIQTFHEVAYKVIETGEEMLISPENYSKWAGTKPGINMPIYFHQEIVGVIGISGSPDEVIPFGKAVKMMTEMMLQQASLTEQVELEERSKNFLVQDMVSGSLPPSREAAMTRAGLLGIDLSLPRSVMIIQMHGSDQKLNELEMSRHRIRKAASFFRQPEQVLISPVRRDRWIVVTELSAYRNEKQIKNYLYEISGKMAALISSYVELEIRIALGNCYQNVYELPQSFQEALTILDIIDRFPDNGNIMHIDDVALELMLTEVSEQARSLIIRESLGELVHHPELLDTLRSLFDCNLNLALTSQALNIHRNTLLYRLERIEQMVAANPRDFHHAVRMQIALLLLKSKKR